MQLDGFCTKKFIASFHLAFAFVVAQSSPSINLTINTKREEEEKIEGEDALSTLQHCVFLFVACCCCFSLVYSLVSHVNQPKILFALTRSFTIRSLFAASKFRYFIDYVMNFQ